MAPKSLTLLSLLGAARVAVAGITVDWSDLGSVKQAASTLAYDSMSYYTGNLSGQTPGILPGPPPAGPYYWWEAGALWGTMIDYWHYTKDVTYNEVVKAAIIAQSGPNDDFMDANWTASLGNDDQGFWGMTAMDAAETNFSNPDSSQPQWLGLAQGVFNTMASPDRHDSTCGGGLRWQIPKLNNGYDYKNTIANGCFFNIAARLYRYSGNETFLKWAESEWNWESGVGFITPDYLVYDGAGVESNCTQIDKAQYSYNYGVWLQGVAAMWNHTQSDEWKGRLDGLLNQTLSIFFPKQIATEIICQNSEKDLCTANAWSFKGFVVRWLANVAQLAPYTSTTIMPYLQASAKAAVSQCTGGSNGRTCGFQWLTGVYDGTSGCGQEMSALAAVISTMYNVQGVSGPLTNSSGGSSQGDSNAGSNADAGVTIDLTPITKGDRAGAWILTILAVGSVVLGSAWVSTGFSEPAAI